MVEKIIVNPNEIRGYGNIMNVHSSTDYDLSDCTIESGTDTVNGATETVYTLTPSFTPPPTPTYLFQDDCSSSAGLTNYGSLVSLESSGTSANLEYDSTENAYAITSLSSGMKCFPITALNGLDDFKLSYEFRTPSTTNNYGLGLAPIIASTHTGVGLLVNKSSSGRETVVHRDYNNAETYWGDGQTITGYDTSKYYKIELVIDGDDATWNLYDGDTLLRTYSYTLSSLSTDYNTLSNRDYGITVGWNNSSSVKMYIKNIKAESLSPSPTPTPTGYSLAFSQDTYTYSFLDLYVTVSCTLTNGGTPMSGETVTFSYTRSGIPQTETKTTNSNGVATLTIDPMDTTITATYQGVTAICTVEEGGLL